MPCSAVRAIRLAFVLSALMPAAADADQCSYDYQCETQLRSCEGSSYDSTCRESFQSCVTTCRSSEGSSTSPYYSAPPARARFGAIAYSPSSGAHGYAYNYGNIASAGSRALGECQANADGAGDCEVQVTFQACGALARAPDGSFGTGYGPSRSSAQDEALGVCGQYATSCQVEGIICNDP